MKENVCKRKEDDLRKALEESCKCNKITNKKLREERKKYQELYAKYLKLERLLIKCGNL